jgi:ABC-type iron transport system FetAB ATPase subunit
MTQIDPRTFLQLHKHETMQKAVKFLQVDYQYLKQRHQRFDERIIPNHMFPLTLKQRQYQKNFQMFYLTQHNKPNTFNSMFWKFGE